MRFAYADPPYPGMSGYYKDHPDYAGEVDHAELIERLSVDFPDGWALSTASTTLRYVLGLCPDDVRIAAWRPISMSRSLIRTSPATTGGPSASATPVPTQSSACSACPANTNGSPKGGEVTDAE